MKKSNLCFCIKGDQVLLAMKKRGFGAGKWNGYGGKVQEDEAPKQAAVRELKEESGLTTEENNLTQVALIRFYFDGNPKFECYIYTLTQWEGEPIETEEMRPRWYEIKNLPYDGMWVADVKWIPLILNGETIEAEVNFNEAGDEVRGFEYKKVEFEK